MVVGLRRRWVRQGLTIFLIIGVVAVCAALVARLLDGKPADQHPGTLDSFLTLVFLLLMPSGLWLILCAILGSITLRLSDGMVEQVLCHRIVLKRAPIAALLAVSAGGFSALVLHFRGGVKIALPGIYHDDQVRFIEVLHRMCPDLELR
jgi:hypothetical protein